LDGFNVDVDAYGADPADKYYSVLLHNKLRSLPKTYVTIASKDTLRDEGRLFVEKLQAEG
jgi:versiconal hemiacetal acetate esterase